LSVELSILKAFCLDKQYYSDYYTYTQQLRRKERLLGLLFKLVHEYYDKYSLATDIESDDFKSWYDHQYPNGRDEEEIKDMIDATFRLNVNTDLVKSLIEQWMEKYYANQIIDQLMPVMEGNKFGRLSNITAQIEQYNALLTNPPEEVRVVKPLDLTTEEIVNATILQTGYKFPIPKMNEVIGGLRPCSNGMIYGYTDSGKSSLAFLIAASVAEEMKDTEDTVLYCGNEETAVRAGGRATMAFTGFDRFDLLLPDIQKEADKMKAERGWSRLKICDTIETGEQITRLMDEWRPKVVIIDQATDVEVTLAREAEGTDYFKELFKWYRRLGNVYETAVVAIGQAGVDAENEKWVKLSQMYGSRAGIQGRLDWAAGIGKKLEDAALEHMRFINITKNKYGGKDRCSCHFNHETCQWEENV
jgi:KaiC/GvpD/RAD55 family RecA-like ATPase